MTSTVRRWLPWTLLLAALVVALIVGATRSTSPRTPEERVRHITSQLRCPVCEGETVADSNALISQDIRTLVRQRVQARQSDSAILSYVVRQYPGTLLDPPAHGVGLIVWVLPLIAVAAAVAGLAVAFRRWRGRTGVVVTDADRQLVEKALRR
jgi:cytochrome c-type biogenesis protein CcmH